MKKILAIIFIAGSFAVKTNGQIRRLTDSTQNVVSNSSKSAEKHETMNSLNLTKQQMNQLREFRRYMKQRIDSINTDPSLNDGQKQSQLKDLRREQKEKLISILTPGQMEKLREERKQLRMQQDKQNQTGN